MAAFEEFCKCGLDPEQFFRLTPYQAGKVIEGARDNRTILAWHVAALSRQKKLPKLEKMLKQAPVDVEAKMKLLFGGK